MPPDSRTTGSSCTPHARVHRATYSGSSMAVTCACVLLVLASVGAALPVDSRYELDEMGEPEWNFPADWDGSAQ
eukprot:COSAG02_NODE_1396_length_12898_cov_23.802953_1_plen_73_part_10